MDAERWLRIKSILSVLLDLPPADRDSALLEACGNDRVLAEEVNHYLAIDEASGAFLADAPLPLPTLVDLLSDHERDQAPIDRSGEQIGPYRLVRVIGRGGMGQVYLARQEKAGFERDVAVKLLRRGLDTEDILTRFRNERRILAGLSHPNIARLIDGGVTDDGTPYFVMEFIDGEPITSYCDERKLAIRDRIKLFTTVCDAVQHAHSNLVVHRDLKPSNILVTAQGRVKLLDFGIAKVLEPDPAEYSIHITRSEVRVLTPEYASPEQIRGEAVSTTSDVYSLGVLLYELLTGQRPLRIPTRLQAHIEQLMASSNPKRPSTAVVDEVIIRQADGETQTITPEFVSAARGTRVERLKRQLQGDLDNIALMALRKEPERRYASAEALGADVHRFLSGDPIRARKDTRAYRLRKFLQRNPFLTGAAALIVALLLLFAVSVAIQSSRISKERDLARTERDKAQQVSNFLTELFRVADPTESHGRQVTARELLDEGSDRILEQLSGQPEVQVPLLRVMGQAYGNLAEYRRADSLLAVALDLGPHQHAELASILEARGHIAHQRSRYRTADSLLTKALSLASLSVTDADLATRIRSRLGDVHFDMAHYARADSLHRLALREIEAKRRPDQDDISQAKLRLARTLAAHDRFDEAQDILNEVMIVQRRAFGDTSSQHALVLRALGALSREQGLLSLADSFHVKSLARYRRVFGSEHPEVARGLNDLAGVALDRAGYYEAEQLYEESLRIADAAFGPTNVLSLRIRNNIGSVHISREQYDRALTIFEGLIGDVVVYLGEVHPLTADVRHNLSYMLSLAGELDRSEEEGWKAIEVYRALYGDDHSDVAYTLSSHAVFLMTRRADTAQAENLATKALEIRKRILPRPHPRVANSLITTGAIIQKRSPKEAVPLLREAVNERIGALEEGHWEIDEAKRMLGNCLLDLGEYEEAESLLQSSYRALMEKRGEDSYYTKEAKRRLAELYEKTGT